MKTSKKPIERKIKPLLSTDEQATDSPNEHMWRLVPVKWRTPAAIVMAVVSVVGFIVNTFKEQIFAAHEKPPVAQVRADDKTGTLQPQSSLLATAPANQDAALSRKTLKDLCKDVSQVVSDYNDSTYAKPEIALGVKRAKQAVVLHYQIREKQEREKERAKAEEHTRMIGRTQADVMAERPLIPSIQKIVDVSQALESLLLRIKERPDFPSSRKTVLESYLKDLSSLKQGYTTLCIAVQNSASDWKSKFESMKNVGTWDYALVFFNIREFAGNL